MENSNIFFPDLKADLRKDGMSKNSSLAKYIRDGINEFSKEANELNVDKFVEEVGSSFYVASGDAAVSEMHYVLLVPIDLNMYYNKEQHSQLKRYGFSREGSPERYRNIFFATEKVINEMCEIMVEDEMKVDYTNDPNTQIPIAVVTLNGIDNSHYSNDYGEKTDE